MPVEERRPSLPLRGRAPGDPPPGGLRTELAFAPRAPPTPQPQLCLADLPNQALASFPAGGSRAPCSSSKAKALMLCHRLGRARVPGPLVESPSAAAETTEGTHASQTQSLFPPPGGKVTTLGGFGQPPIGSLLFQGGKRRAERCQGHLSGDVRDSSESPSWSKPGKGRGHDANTGPLALHPSPTPGQP